MPRLRAQRAMLGTEKGLVALHDWEKKGKKKLTAAKWCICEFHDGVVDDVVR
jgi:hypothetical protein